MENLPFSEACERNKKPILEVLQSYALEGDLLEIGFGTAQHCEFLSQNLNHLQWYASDHEDYHWIFKERLRPVPQNIHGPFSLWADEVSFLEQCKKQKLPLSFDALFSANTLHIMNERQCDYFCQHVSDILKSKGLLFLYGPFRFEDRAFSESNQRFHEDLVSRGVGSGIRDFERIKSLLDQHNVKQLKIHDLPSNNHLLVFQKQ